MLRKIENLKIVNKEEGEFIGKYDGEDVRGWMMTEDAFKARIELLKGYDINKVALWYGGKFLADTPNLREIVYGQDENSQ